LGISTPESIGACYDAINVDFSGSWMWFKGGGDAPEFMIRSVVKYDNEVTIEYAWAEDSESTYLSILNGNEDRITIDFGDGPEHFTKAEFKDDYLTFVDNVDCEEEDRGEKGD